MTGASGFVGANLARRLLRDGCEVHLLLRPEHTRWRLDAIRGQVAAHLTDLSDAGGVERVVAAVRPDWVFHLAAHGAYSWQTDDRQILATNVLGAANLVQACVRTGFEAFVHAGSSSEYGFQDHAPAETETPAPNSHYAVGKAAATLLCRFSARKHGLRIITLRLYTVYGPFEEPTRLVPTIIVRGLRGELPPLVDPRIARDFVHVDDVAEAFVRAADRTDQAADAIYNVGAGVQTTLQEVVSCAQRVLRIPSAPQWGSMANRAWDTDVWVSDPREIRAKLGWSATISFAEGFERTVQWLQGNPDLLRYYQSRASAAAPDQR